MNLKHAHGTVWAEFQFKMNTYVLVDQNRKSISLNKWMFSGFACGKKAIFVSCKQSFILSSLQRMASGLWIRGFFFPFK